MKKGRIWGLVFVALAILSVWAVISQSKCFSFTQLMDTLKNASPVWMTAAVAAMFGFIFFEGMAVLCILRALGYRQNLARGFLYSAADIYFSAITPSATGGQPASAFFMMQDQIPGMVVTISLVANLIMHSLALLTVGTAGFCFKSSVFLSFHWISRIFMIVGYCILCCLALAFCVLIAKPRILETVCGFFLNLGSRLHLVRHVETKRKKFRHAMWQYRWCAGVMGRHKLMFVKVFGWNLLQRISQISVTAFVFLAFGGDKKEAFNVWFTQGFAAVGTYSVPIPGGMGVADYLLIDGFRAFSDEASAVNLELVSRGLSFYVSMLISAATVLVGVIHTIRKKKRVQK